MGSAGEQVPYAAPVVARNPAVACTGLYWLDIQSHCEYCQGYLLAAAALLFVWIVASVVFHHRYRVRVCVCVCGAVVCSVWLADVVPSVWWLDDSVYQLPTE